VRTQGFVSLLLITDWGIVWEGRDDELGGYLVVLDENTYHYLLDYYFYFILAGLCLQDLGFSYQ